MKTYEETYMNEQDRIFKKLEELRGRITPLTPFEARKIKYIPQHEKLYYEYV